MRHGYGAVYSLATYMVMSENYTPCSAFYEGWRYKKKDNPDELSCLVDQTIELSNPFIEGYMAVVEFAKEFL